MKIKRIWNHHLLIGNPYNGYINPYYWIDEFFPYGNNGSFDPIAQVDLYGQIIIFHQPRFPWNKTISWGVPLLPCHLVRSCEVAKGALNSTCHDHCESGWTSSGTFRKNGWRTVSEAPKIAGIGGDQKWNVSDLLGEGSCFFSWIESCHIIDNARCFNTHTQIFHNARMN